MTRKMKDSGIEWIGNIPANWTVCALKWCADIIMGQSPASEDITNQGTTLFMQGNREFGVKYPCPTIYCDNCSKHSRVGDILMSVRAPVGAINESDKVYGIGRGLCSIKAADIDNSFLKYYLMKSVDDLRFYSTGSTFEAITIETINAFRVAIPPNDEQRSIAEYLDQKCAKINIILEKTRASIEEYKKLKQAVITQAVTQGVRNDREMKDSGTKWIKKVPSDIKISRVGLHYEIILGKMLCTNQIDDTYTYEPYFCAADIHFEGIAESERKKMWFSSSEKKQYLVKKGDLLVVEGGAGAGGCTIAPIQEVPTYIQNSIMIVRSRKSADVRYLKYLIECLVKQGYIDVACNKATIPHFTKDKLANVPFLTFSIQEQKEIAQYLDKKCGEIDRIIAKKEQYITELESYKKSLIYEYVTGKKEVLKEYQA